MVSLTSKKEFLKTAALGPLAYMTGFHLPFSSLYVCLAELRWHQTNPAYLCFYPDTKATVSLRQRPLLVFNVGKCKDLWLYQMLSMRDWWRLGLTQDIHITLLNLREHSGKGEMKHFCWSFNFDLIAFPYHKQTVSIHQLPHSESSALSPMYFFFSSLVLVNVIKNI